MSHNKHLQEILFDCQYSQQQQDNTDNFHNTFGNRQNLHTPLTNNQHSQQRQQTRIRLLASFQQSYLDKSNATNNKRVYEQGEITSQPFYTENLPTTYLKDETEQEQQLDNYKCMTQKSVQRKPISKNYRNKYADRIKYSHNNSEVNQFEDSMPKKDYAVPRYDRQHYDQPTEDNEEEIRNAAEKIKQLRKYIADQLYAIQIQDQVYKFLMHKIDNANKNISAEQHRKDKKGQKEQKSANKNINRKQQYYDQVIDNAIQFMDCADSFVKEFKILNSMIDHSKENQRM